MPHHTDKPETRHQRNHARKLTLEEEEIMFDENIDDGHHPEGFHDVVVVSRQHHLDNIEASGQFLKLLNFHHGRDKGFSDGYSP